MDHDQRIELEEIEKSNRIDYNIDREEIAMQYKSDDEVTVTEIPVMALDDVDAMIQQMFGAREEPSVEVKALEVLMPIIDAGVDIMAMEGAAKNGGEFATLEGQFKIRGELVDGILEALGVFGVEKKDIFYAMENVQESGFRFKQGPEDIADRLTAFDRVSLINLLYGPKLAGVILSEQIKAEQNGEADGSAESQSGLDND